MPDPDDLVFVNGINGLTGEYLVAPLEPSELAAHAKEPPEDPELAHWLEQMWETVNQPTFGLPFNVRPEVVAEAGWAIVFASDEADAVKRALEPLIEHRRQCVGGEKVKVLDYFPNETWRDWLDRHGVGPGNINPRKVPYYLLLIGSPGRMPFSFQYLLDVEYAVGRLHFDSVEGYRDYVDALIDYEEAATAPGEKSAAFFGTRHPFDKATQQSADWLVQPLAQSFQPGGQFADAVHGYQIRTCIGPAATKGALEEILSGTGELGRPAVLFTASHGLGGWPPGHPDQKARQGALLCQDWPGLGTISPSQYLAATDVSADARVHGLVAFFFACYGAGTPQVDPFRHRPGEAPPIIADEPFVAALPKRLLAHPNGGALAVIGHIERAWGYSFVSGSEAQLLPFQNAVGRMLAGQPVGFAMKDFNEKYAALSAHLSDTLEKLGFGKVISDATLASLWTERNDAQNYVLLGDPAATLKTPEGMMRSSRRARQAVPAPPSPGPAPPSPGFPSGWPAYPEPAEQQPTEQKAAWWTRLRRKWRSRAAWEAAESIPAAPVAAPPVQVNVGADMPASVQVGRLVTVACHVSWGAIEAAAGRVRDEGRISPDPARSITLQVLPKANVEVVGEERADVAVPEEGQASDVYFDVRATHVGSCQVWVVVRQGPAPLLTLRLVAAATDEEQSWPVSRETAQATVGVADITGLDDVCWLSVIELERGGDTIYRFELRSSALGILESFDSRPLRNRGPYIKGLYREIEERWLSTAGDIEAFQEELREFGGSLLTELFPERLQELLWSYRDSLQHLLVLSSEPFIPWELVHLKPPGHPLPDEVRFLAQIGLVRWLYCCGGYPPHALRARAGRVHVLRPDYPHPDWKLAKTADEERFLVQTLGAIPVTPTEHAVRSLLRSGEIDVLHFAGHGVASGDDIANAKVCLQGRLERGKYIPGFLSATTVAQQARLVDADGNRPLVVLNACQVGRLGHQMSSLGGFAQAFLDGGAGAFISSMWSVGDVPAATFVQTLYRELLSNEPMCIAVSRARESSRQAGDGTWLAYTVYAHPTSRLFVSAGQPTALRNTRASTPE